MYFLETYYKYALRYIKYTSTVFQKYRPLLHKLCKLLVVFSPAEIELYTSDILLYFRYEVYFKYTFGDILTSKACDF